jgi:cell division septation protein DedD
MILAGTILAVGLLWQNNMLGHLNSNPAERPSTTREVKIPIKEQPAPPAPPVAVASQSRGPAGEEQKDLPLKPEPAPPAAVENKPIAVVAPPKQEAAPPLPAIPPAEIKTEAPIGSSDMVRVEKTEQQPPVEEPKVEQKIEANRTPAAKEKPKADAPPARSLTGATYPFSLFLGSVPHLDQAAQGVLKYRNHGLPAYYTEVTLSKGIWYRLYAGYFESEEQAESFKKEKRLEEAEVKETPFANLIGTFTSQDKLESKIQSLKSLGFSPYVIRDADGKQRLLVGAFYNEERAKTQYEELKSKGVENQIVQR